MQPCTNESVHEGVNNEQGFVLRKTYYHLLCVDGKIILSDLLDLDSAQRHL